MTSEPRSGDLHRARFERADLTEASFRGVALNRASFVDVDLSRATFRGADLSGVVMRGIDIAGADLDAPWLLETGESALLVNGVDVAPYVEEQLNARFPGRAGRRASDPDGLRSAWAAVERTWAATSAHVAGLPRGTVDESVNGEWSFAQTLRHLIMATDTWLRKAILHVDEPFHPAGQPDASFEADGEDVTAFSATAPSFAEVVEVRAERVGMVRDFLATVTPDILAESRANPHDPSVEETVLGCLRTIIEEEWEHHRFAVRDLALVEAQPG